MSTAKFDTLSNLAGTQSVPVATVAQGSAKAWVNFNGTGTVAIRASFNVSSITDNGTGVYTLNFTNALPDANYAYTFGGADVSWGNKMSAGGSTTASAFQLYTFTGSGTTSNQADLSVVNVAIFR